MSSKYEQYIEQQRRQYAKSTPIKNWRKQFKNGKSNQELLDMVPKVPPGCEAWALDIGAGEGYHTEDLKNMGYCVRGVELLEKRVADAHKLGRRYVQQGDAHDLKLGDESFDVVFMHEVLEHCAYPDKALSEIRRVLKPMGFFYISLPLEGHWKKPQKGIDEHNLSTRDTHVWKPTASMLWDALKDAGFFQWWIRLYELDSIKYRMEYKKVTTGVMQTPIGFRPHAFVEGQK